MCLSSDPSLSAGRCQIDVRARTPVFEEPAPGYQSLQHPDRFRPSERILGALFFGSGRICDCLIFALQPIEDFIRSDARRVIFHGLLPYLAQFLNARLAKIALVRPVAQRVADYFAAGGVFAGFDRLTDKRDHLGGESDTDFLDGSHGWPSW